MTRWALPLLQFSGHDPSVRIRALNPETIEVCTGLQGGKIELAGPPGQIGQADWGAAGYLVMDVVHHSHDVFVIVVNLATNENATDSDRIEVHFGVLPNVPTRLCLPLSALNAQQLFLSRYPSTMQTTLRGGAGIRADQVKFFSIGTIESVSPRAFNLSNVFLSTEEPDFLTHEAPIVDDLGQHLAKVWPGKIKSDEELKKYLQNEKQREEHSVFYRDHWGRYGGWKGLQFDATGYFRTHHDGQRFWLVDPEGYAFISMGFDCVNPGEFMKVNGMEHLTRGLPKTGSFQDAWAPRPDSGDQFSYAISNLIRAFGDGWWERWAEITLRRHREWGLNTIANWSQSKFIRYAKMPYVWPLVDFPTTANTIFRDFPDVFHEEYSHHATQFAKQLETFADDPLLIGYFLRNEPHFAFVDNLNIAEKMLENPVHFASKDRFIDHLRNRYGNSVKTWNQAWGSEFSSFEDLLLPIHHAAKPVAILARPRLAVYLRHGVVLHLRCQSTDQTA